MVQRRFPFCRDYKKCLWHAVVHNRTLDCRGCPDYEPIEREYQKHEVAGMFALLDRIFNRRIEGHTSLSRWVSRPVGHGK